MPATKSKHDTSRWLTVKECSARSGMAAQTIRRMIEDGALPAYRPRRQGQIFVKAEDLSGAIEAALIQAPNQTPAAV